MRRIDRFSAAHAEHWAQDGHMEETTRNDARADNVRLHLAVQDLERRLVVDVEGALEQSFHTALRASLAREGIDWARFSDLGVAASFLEEPDGVHISFLIFPTDSLADVARLFGDDGRSDPPRFLIHGGGFGGGADEFLQLWDVATALGSYALTASGVAGLMLQALVAARAIRFRKSRALVVDWGHSGEIPQLLLERVREHSFWTDEEVADEFNVDALRSGELMRAAGFTWRVSPLSALGYWERDDVLPPNA